MRNYRQWLVFSKVILTLLGLTGWYGPAQAAVNIDRTRIIFASDDVAQSLTLSNDNTTPMLLQVWTDAGNIDASPDNSKTPLVALPPVFKMQPRTENASPAPEFPPAACNGPGESLLAKHLSDTASHQTLKPPAKTGVTASFEAKILIRPTGLKAPTEAEEKNYALLLKRILYG